MGDGVGTTRSPGTTGSLGTTELLRVTGSQELLPVTVGCWNVCSFLSRVKDLVHKTGERAACVYFHSRDHLKRCSCVDFGLGAYSMSEYMSIVVVILVAKLG